MESFVLTARLIFALNWRGIHEEEVGTVVRNPEQRIEVRPGRWVYQSSIKKADRSKICLLRVFVDTDRVPWEIATAYLTSKIDKYWS